MPKEKIESAVLRITFISRLDRVCRIVARLIMLCEAAINAAHDRGQKRDANLRINPGARERDISPRSVTPTSPGMNSSPSWDLTGAGRVVSAWVIRRDCFHGAPACRHRRSVALDRHGDSSRNQRCACASPISCRQSSIVNTAWLRQRRPLSAVGWAKRRMRVPTISRRDQTNARVGTAATRP